MSGISLNLLNFIGVKLYSVNRVLALVNDVEEVTVNFGSHGLQIDVRGEFN